MLSRPSIRSFPPLLWPACAALVLACEIRVESPPHRDSNPAADPSFPGDPLFIRTPAEPDLPQPSPAATPDYPPTAPPMPPDLYPALIVLDPALIQGPLARSGNADAPFSFRSQMEWLAGARDALDFTREWLLQWETVTTIGAAEAPVTPRPAVRSLLLDRWREASGAAVRSPSPDAY